jgi:predicted HAD superfamily Cof-like phosphohydrolase
MTPEEMVREFHASKRIHAGWIPGHPTSALPPGLADLRQALLDEEVAELHGAMAAGNLTEIADALGDIAYVLGGTAVVYGLPFPVGFTSGGDSPPACVTEAVRVILLDSADSAARGLRDAVLAGEPPAVGAAVLRFARTLDDIAALHGIPLQAVFEAVHISNMTKVNTPAEGKLVKGPGYRPPNIAGALARKQSLPQLAWQHPEEYEAGVAAGRYETGGRP